MCAWLCVGGSEGGGERERDKLLMLVNRIQPESNITKQFVIT